MKKFLFASVFLIMSILSYAQDYTDEYGYAEKILNFHSDIVIDTTGRVEVTETIKIYARGFDIRRGIVRRIPVYREDNKGEKKRINIKLLSVLRDGREDDFTEEYKDENYLIYIGNKDYILPEGIYEYSIKYESYGHIGFFDDFDELYWNVTGNGWAFDIEKASAKIILPNDVKPIKTTCYTGVFGSKDQDCVCSDSSNVITFSTTKILSRNEGLTIAVAFPRDIVKRPPPPSRAELFWQEYKQYICSSLGLILISVFYIITWQIVGKDPESPVSIPTFNPPNNWSATVIRFLYKKGMDAKAFTTVIISMAVKGSIFISNDGDRYVLSNCKKENHTLSKEELAVYNKLFAERNSIVVSQSYYETISGAIFQLNASVESEWNIKKYFKDNKKYKIWAVVINFFVVILYMGLVESLIPVILLLLLFFIVACYWFIKSLFKLGLRAFKVFILILGIGTFFVPLIMNNVGLEDGIFSAIFILLLFIAFLVYVYLIEAPTKMGSRTESELKGFKMYLETAEEDRLNMFTPPDHTPELFERLLPYAVALDVENKWSKKFDSILKAASYSPTWYIGVTPFMYTPFANSFTSSVNSANINPTPPAPDTSFSSGSSGWGSGTGGGGFSGGGGGGGGGGW